MDQYLYKCHYCGKDYKPRRRHKQKFCSNSCRVNAFNIRTKKDKSIAKVSTNPTEINKKKVVFQFAGYTARYFVETAKSILLVTVHLHKQLSQRPIAN